MRHFSDPILAAAPVLRSDYDTIIGRVRATSGHVYFKGEDITYLPEYQIVQRGICRKFQTPGVLPSLTVLDNLLIAACRDRRPGICRDVLRS